MEFQTSVEGIISYLPAGRQIMLYSATFPVAVKQFKEKFLSRPHIINLMEELTLKGITQVGIPALIPSMLLSKFKELIVFQGPISLLQGRITELEATR